MDRSLGAPLAALVLVLGACAGATDVRADPDGLASPIGSAPILPDGLSTLDLPSLSELADPGALSTVPTVVAAPPAEPATSATSATATAPPTTVDTGPTPLDPGPTPSTPAAPDPSAAAASWAAMLSTTLPEPIAVAAPVEGPGGAPTALSAGDRWVVVWRAGPNGWDVTQRVALVDQEVAAEEAWLLGRPFDAIVTDGTGEELRFLVPTRTADGPAVAALGMVDGTWMMLAFTGLDGGPRTHAPGATLEGGRILVWPACEAGCADGDAGPWSVTRIDAGYAIRTGR